jgi:hypothetical protein
MLLKSQRTVRTGSAWGIYQLSIYQSKKRSAEGRDSLKSVSDSLSI